MTAQNVRLVEGLQHALPYTIMVLGAVYLLNQHLYASPCQLLLLL